MPNVIRGIGTLSVFVVAGAVGFGAVAPAETNWDALRGADWGGKQPGEVAKLVEASSGGDYGAAIRDAFVNLGMTEPRAECYGKVLVEQLSPEGQQEAARLVSEAASADDVKTSVISGGPDMVGGFSAADAMCPESLG